MNPNPKFQHLGESVLVVLAQTRDLAAFQELVIRYQGRLTYYVRRLVGCTHESEDVLQEVWLVVYRRLSTLKSPQAFRVWLFKIAHDLAVNHLRRSARLPKPLSPEIEQSEILDTWNEFDAMRDVELVHQTLDSLSHEHREVLTLRFLEQMELSEIAEVVSCSIGTVKSRLHYAKMALRQKIQGEIDE